MSIDQHFITNLWEKKETLPDLGRNISWEEENEITVRLDKCEKNVWLRALDS